jgi:hypothetical protein
MAWLRIALPDADQAVVNAEPGAHPHAHVRRKMLALWLPHCGPTRVQAATIAGLGRATVRRYVAYLFVDAAHFVYGTFRWCPWSVARVFVRAASGRQRSNVPGPRDAVARTLAAVTNTTVVNTDTMGDLPRAVAARGLAGPVTLVLDNAR